MNFDALSSSQLVSAYNTLTSHVDEGDIPNFVKKFSDRPTAVKRVSGLLERINSHRAEAGSALVEIQEDGTVAVAKSEEIVDLPETPDATTTEGPVLAAQAERVESEFEQKDEPSDNQVDETPEVTETNETTNEAPSETAEQVVPPVEPVVEKPVKNVAKKNGAKNLGGRPPLVADTDIITVVHVGANPKRAAAAVRFGRYKSGMSVEEYAKAIGGDRRQALRDVAWDLKMKWISVAGAPKKAAAKDEPKTEGGAA